MTRTVILYTLSWCAILAALTGANQAISSDKTLYKTGDTVVLTCNITGITFAQWKNGTSGNTLSSCSASGCLPARDGDLTYTIGSSTMTVSISNLLRLDHGIDWICTDPFGSDIGSFSLSPILTPQTENPVVTQDEECSFVSCESGCVYPYELSDVNFTWSYIPLNGNPKRVSHTSPTNSINEAGCPPSEGRVISTLNLTGNPLNQSNIRMQCNFVQSNFSSTVWNSTGNTCFEAKSRLRVGKIPDELWLLTLLLLFPLIYISVRILKPDTLLIDALDIELQKNTMNLHWKPSVACQPNSMKVTCGSWTKNAAYDETKYSVYLTDLEPGTEYKVVISCQRMSDGKALKSDTISVYTLSALNATQRDCFTFPFAPLRMTVKALSLELKWNSSLDLKGASAIVNFDNSEVEVKGILGVYKIEFEKLRHSKVYTFHINGIGEDRKKYASGEIKVKTLKDHGTSKKREAQRPENSEKKESRNNRQVGCDQSKAENAEITEGQVRKLGELQQRETLEGYENAEIFEDGSAKLTTLAQKSTKFEIIQEGNLCDLKSKSYPTDPSVENVGGEVNPPDSGHDSPRKKKKRRKKSKDA